jgi:hypothetical protein
VRGGERDMTCAGRPARDVRKQNLRYTLVESSVSVPADGDEDGYFSILGEAQLRRGPHRPHVRLVQE